MTLYEQGSRSSGSKFIMPDESPLSVCNLTPCDSNIVSLTDFEIFDITAIFYYRDNGKNYGVNGSRIGNHLCAVDRHHEQSDLG